MAEGLYSLGQTGELLNVRIGLWNSIFSTKDNSGAFPMLLNTLKHEILVVDDD
jgi:hypothetical protein